MNLKELESKTMPFDKFDLKCRFTKVGYNILPSEHLQQIKALNDEAHQSIENLIFGSGVMGHYQLNKKYFEYIIELDINLMSKKEV